jgi:hypothetical protein
MKVHPRGNPASKVWFILDQPSESDFSQGRPLTGGTGFVFDKILVDAGLPTDAYIVPFIEDETTHDAETRKNIITVELETHRPPIIITLGKEPTGRFAPETLSKKKTKGKHEAQLDKYSGSLLTSPYLSYPHYIVPTQPPLFVVQNYWYRDIQVSIDLGHVREEISYLQQNKVLQPLSSRVLITEPDYDTLMGFLAMCRGVPYISVDIETIRPPKGSVAFKKHCGYPYTIGIAPNKNTGISFSVWDYTPLQLCRIWREVDWLLREIPQIGQNYFGFDYWFLEALGFTLCLDKCQDTMIRHHILWPELEHKLQFLCKQYTRQPYYKDEGKQWSPKYKKSLMRYNCLDVCVTYEVWEEQEKEFATRLHLK